jgi:hypothetical protein
MKKLLLPLMGLLCLSATAQHQLQKIWATDTIVAIPESVLPDLKKGILYVSLIDGGGWDADGKGGVAKLSPDGKKYDGSWITGLNAPKGLGMYGNRMYAADISEVVVIDVPKGKVEKKIAIPDANGLNDITVSDKGIVYVSDSRTSKVWRIENDHPVLFLDSMKGVNGLKAIGNDLYILSGKHFVKADAQKNITTVAELDQAGDGLEPIGNGDFLATSWGGWIYYVHKDGKIETLLDTHLDKKNTADIGYDPAKKIVYVPTFNAKSVVAYQLK